MRGSSLSLWKTILSSSVASTFVPLLSSTPLSRALTRRSAVTCTRRPKRTSSTLSRVRARSKLTSSSLLMAR